MPGIYEEIAEPETQNVIEMSSAEERVNDESSNGVVDEANAVPPAEVNQTDKINKFLLKSFLERMNNELVATNDDRMETTDGEDTAAAATAPTNDREWQ